jgi:8-oxo-dGTP diphosphatase
MSRPDVHVDLHLVLLKDGCVLMGGRTGTAFASGQYHVPAGRLEPDETIVDGIIREAREETGIAIEADEIRLVYVMHFRGETDRMSLFFTADNWRGPIENREPDKCAGWEWIRTDALPEHTVPYARHALGELLAGRNLGLFGWHAG